MEASFKEKTVQQIVQQFFKDDKTKVTAEALTLLTEVITVFVAEAASRTAKQAKKDGDDEITLEQFEKILPQLVRDKPPKPIFPIGQFETDPNGK